MQDEQLSPSVPPLLPPARRRTSLRTILLAGLIAFLLGAGGVAWLAWHGDLAAYLPHAERGAAPQPVANPPATAGAPTVSNEALGAAEMRVALLEQRLSRIDLQASAASGNATRAEALLIAFAARRAIDRGTGLGYIENQLKLRFADAQPNAVRTVIEAARKPVTIDDLTGGLDAQAAALARAPREGDTWTRLRGELAGLFVIRRETTHATDPQNRLIRARLFLAAGKIEPAIAEVQRLPGAAQAQAWIASARRYAEVQRALDLIETTALLEPRRLQDDAGQSVDQPSPLVPPVEATPPAVGAQQPVGGA